MVLLYFTFIYAHLLNHTILFVAESATATEDLDCGKNLLKIGNLEKAIACFIQFIQIQAD